MAQGLSFQFSHESMVFLFLSVCSLVYRIGSFCQCCCREPLLSTSTCRGRLVRWSFDSKPIEKLPKEYQCNASLTMESAARFALSTLRRKRGSLTRGEARNWDACQGFRPLDVFAHLERDSFPSLTGSQAFFPLAQLD